MSERLPDQELLNRFVLTGSEDAFHHIVERYLGMVFALSLRRLRDRQLAEEAA